MLPHAQGLMLGYNFNQYEAYQAFSLAAGLDPASPMPPWGIAWALGPGANRCPPCCRARPFLPAMPLQYATAMGFDGVCMHQGCNRRACTGTLEPVAAR